MRCTKCGNEIRDGVKFCPQCGGEVEEKRVKFCTKCGSELHEEAVFCAKCGASIGTVQKEGVPARPTKQNMKHKKIFMIVGIAVVLFLIIGCIILNSERTMYKAYVKFHEEYCDKNAEYEELNDCAARIIMAPGNEKWLAIYDVTNLQYDEDGDVKDDSVWDKITLYKYRWGKVKKVAVFSKDSIYTSRYTNFSLIDGKLYLMLFNHGTYCLNDNNRFEMIKINKEEAGDEGERKMASGMKYSDFITLIAGDPLFYDDYGFSSCYWEKYERYKKQLLFMNDVRSTEINEFVDVVDELSEYKIKNQVDLQVAYGNILKEFGLCNVVAYDDSLLTGYPIVGTMKTEYGYYLIRTSGNAELIKVSEKNDLYDALKSADGRKVTRIECIESIDVPENLKIPEGITHVGGFKNQEKLKSVELPNTLKEIGSDAFYDCINLQNVQIPSSIEKIGKYAFCNCTGLQQIELPDSIRKIGEDAFEITDGLSPVIIASEGSYAQQYAVENNLDWSEKKLSKAELEERELIGEALESYQNYVDNWDNETELLGMALAYINADNIPECILWARIDSVYYSDNNILLSYTADGMIEEGLGFSQFGYEGIKYSSKAGKICREYWVNGVGENYTIYSFDKELVTFAEINDFMAAAEPEYTVNGENYGSHEAIEEYMSSLGLVNSFSEEDVCDNVREAYNKLKKVN